MGIFNFFKKRRSQEIFFGLSRANDDQIMFQAECKDVEYEGDVIPEFIDGLCEKMPLKHFVIVPNIGLFILVKDDGRFKGYAFNSSMSENEFKNYAHYLKNIAKIEVKINEEFSAFEFINKQNVKIQYKREVVLQQAVQDALLKVMSGKK
jgi:hypothetical protein